ncbi:MAG TPA: DNA primase, partial [Streptosporangiaceae bacterium]|nr:DNA primase [Streptosporangiaceae bacterium]
MAGRIRDEDIALIRERSAIDEVVGEYLQLRGAGGGSLKGLCPFHDEKTPSFNVTPARGLWYCFSCSEGGDVIKFVQKIDNLGFTEAVERLAARAGIELRYEQGGHIPGREQSQRRRLIEAHRIAADYYVEQLSGPGASAGREFLSSRGFELVDAAKFGVGFAPADWDSLTRHLRGRGFTDAEMLAGGLASQGRRGLIDKFRGRLMWPIADLAGDVIAFGARKLAADDDGPKYLNTPETVLFKKSAVLYGASLAKRDIAQRRQAVLVEGYTDVMACHLAGITTAVATSGTSFGDGHITILRRLLMDDSQFRGEVIFTFDGDAAGQRAALRAFSMEEKFVTQTFVAVQGDGLDPCDLRLKHGDAAVRDLIAQRVPLFEFAIRSALHDYDLDTAEGRLAALDAAAPIVARIKDRGLRQLYAVSLDRWLGMMDEGFVLDRVLAHSGAPAARGRAGQGKTFGTGRGQAPTASFASQASQSQRNGVNVGRFNGGTANGGTANGGTVNGGRDGSGNGARRAASGQPAPRPYDSNDPIVNVERQALKLAIQRPALCGPVFDELPSAVFTIPAHAAVCDLIAASGGVASAGSAREWSERLRAAAPNDNARSFVTRLAVESLEVPGEAGEPDARFAEAVLARVEELSVSRDIARVKSRLQRMSPVTEQAEYNRMFGDLVALEQRKKVLS